MIASARGTGLKTLGTARSKAGIERLMRFSFAEHGQKGKRGRREKSSSAFATLHPLASLRRVLEGIGQRPRKNERPPEAKSDGLGGSIDNATPGTSTPIAGGHQHG
jgi:hypothetical protein